MYKVIKAFVDFDDDLFSYEVGDAYPRVGYTPTPERIEELAGPHNLQHTPLISKAERRTRHKTED